MRPGDQRRRVEGRPGERQPWSLRSEPGQEVGVAPGRLRRPAHLGEGEQIKLTLFDGYTSQFLNVDKVVVANPLWNLNVPTRLKAWIDTIAVAGQTFRYNEDGVAVGLVHGKKAVHIQTSGGVFEGFDPASMYVKTIFTFLGVEDFQQVFAEGMDHDPEHAGEIVAAALDRVREVAAAF